MTNLPPPDPGSSERRPLGFDDFIGILVAFATIGGIFFWVLSRENEGFRFPAVVSLSPSPATQPNLTPSPEVTERPELVPLPLPIVPPTEAPEAVPPAPPRTFLGRRRIPLTPSPRATERPELVPLPLPIVPPTEAPEAVPPVPPRTFSGRRRIPLTPSPRATERPELVPLPVPVPAPTPAETATPTPAGQQINFVDIPEDYWARPFIVALAQRGIVSGYAGDYFRPNQPVTRAEFAALLQDAFNQTPGQTATKYQDVTSDFWAATAISKATSTGFLQGYPGNIFRPEQQIPRAQVFVALASGLKLPTPSNPTQVLQTYQDAAAIPNYATEEIAAATQAGLVVNYPNQNTLNPNANASRAEVAAILYQALVNAGRLEPIESPYVVQPSQ